MPDTENGQSPEPSIEDALLDYCRRERIGAPTSTSLLSFVNRARAEGVEEARRGLKRHVELMRDGEYVRTDGEIVCATCSMPQYAWSSTPYCHLIYTVPETIEIRGKTYDLGSAFNMQTLDEGGAQFAVTDNDLVVTFPAHLSPVQLAECALALVVLSAGAFVVTPTLELDREGRPTFTLGLDDMLANLEPEDEDEAREEAARQPEE